MAYLELNEWEKESLEKWKTAILEIYGESGDIHFTVNVGPVGTSVIAHSTIANATKDITDYDSW